MITCYGCGAEIEHAHKAHEVKVTLDRVVHVCATMYRSSSYTGMDSARPVPKCLRRALQKLRAEPTCWRCGETGYAVDRDFKLCESCRALLDQGASVAEPRDYCGVPENAVEYHSMGWEKPTSRGLLLAILEATGETVERDGHRYGRKEAEIKWVAVPAEKSRSGSWYYYLYLTGAQQKAVELACSLFDQLVKHAAAEGYEKGSRLLGQLAQGEVTVKDFEEDRERNTRR